MEKQMEYGVYISIKKSKLNISRLAVFLYKKDEWIKKNLSIKSTNQKIKIFMLYSGVKKILWHFIGEISNNKILTYF